MINVPSWKFMEKLGFHRTAEIKKVKYTMLSFDVDCYCYEISMRGLYKIVDYEVYVFTN